MDGASLALFAIEYTEDLEAEYVTDEEFEEMAKIVRRRNKFFPQMADILETREEARAVLTSRKPLIAYDLPEPRDEDRAKCEEWLERTANELGRKLSM